MSAVMVHDAFRERELDALYGELDDAGMAAMAEHAASCTPCRERFERLQGTRSTVRAVAMEAASDDLESRILAAVDARVAGHRAMDAGLAGQPAMPAARPMHALPPGTPPPAEQGAKVFAFLSRPGFAVAATFVLVLGAAAFIMSRSGKMKMAPAASEETEPVASAAAGAPAERAGAPVPMATSIATEPPAAAASAMAMNDPASVGDFAAPPRAVAAAAGPAPTKAARKPSASPSDKQAFAAARALYNAGRYAEALPRFEALQGTADADLYAARCVARINGCAAAAPRYDAVAQANAGSDTGNHATLEGARCYEANGQLAEARKRFTAAKDESGVSAEAQQALDALDGKGQGGGAGAGARAAPRAAPAPAAPPPPPAATMPAK